VTPTVVVVSLVAVFLAFRAGSRWRHHRRTWSDHRVAKAATKKLGKTRWSVLKVALIAVLALLLYETAITVAAAVSNAGDLLREPKPTHSTQPAPVPSHR
jgi:hypothetical protein